MINIKVILKSFGLLLLIESIALLFCALTSLIYEGTDFLALIQSSLICGVTGGVLFLLLKKTSNDIGKREGYIIITFVWIVLTLFGVLPFILSKTLPYDLAFFEVLSGVTTTGSSILTDSDTLPHGLLLWRSMTQWLGGMVILLFSLAILPTLGIGGVQLYSINSVNNSSYQIHPKVKETAKKMYQVYVIITLAETFLLYLGDMNLFEALSHSFSTVSTGGFSMYNSNIAHFDSKYIQYVIIFFMFLAGANFTLSYFAVHLQFKKIIKNEEFRVYTFLILVCTLLFTCILYFKNSDLSIESYFRESLFTIVSFSSTTGFINTNHLGWPSVLVAFSLLLMILGSSSGTTGGGLKMVRVLIVAKFAYAELKKMIHSSAIVPIYYNKHQLNNRIVSGFLTYIVCYILTFSVSVIILSSQAIDLNSSIEIVVSSLGNIGQGIGNFGNSSDYIELSSFSRWYISFLMLLGRVEIFIAILIFSPEFFKK